MSIPQAFSPAFLRLRDEVGEPLRGFSRGFPIGATRPQGHGYVGIGAALFGGNVGRSDPYPIVISALAREPSRGASVRRSLARVRGAPPTRRISTIRLRVAIAGCSFRLQ